MMTAWKTIRYDVHGFVSDEHDVKHETGIKRFLDYFLWKPNFLAKEGWLCIPFLRKARRVHTFMHILK